MAGLLPNACDGQGGHGYGQDRDEIVKAEFSQLSGKDQEGGGGQKKNGNPQLPSALPDREAG